MGDPRKRNGEKNETGEPSGCKRSFPGEPFPQPEQARRSQRRKPCLVEFGKSKGERNGGKRRDARIAKTGRGENDSSTRFCTLCYGAHACDRLWTAGNPESSRG